MQSLNPSLRPQHASSIRITSLITRSMLIVLLATTVIIALTSTCVHAMGLPGPSSSSTGAAPPKGNFTTIPASPPPIVDGGSFFRFKPSLSIPTTSDMAMWIQAQADSPYIDVSLSVSINNLFFPFNSTLPEGVAFIDIFFPLQTTTITITFDVSESNINKPDPWKLYVVSPIPSVTMYGGGGGGGGGSESGGKRKMSSYDDIPPSYYPPLMDGIVRPNWKGLSDATLSSPHALAVSRDGQQVYWSEQTSFQWGGNGVVLRKLDRSTMTVETIAGNIYNPYVVLDGCIFTPVVAPVSSSSSSSSSSGMSTSSSTADPRSSSSASAASSSTGAASNSSSSSSTTVPKGNVTSSSSSGSNNSSSSSSSGSTSSSSTGSNNSSSSTVSSSSGASSNSSSSSSTSSGSSNSSSSSSSSSSGVSSSSSSTANAARRRLLQRSSGGEDSSSGADATSSASTTTATGTSASSTDTSAAGTPTSTTSTSGPATVSFASIDSMLFDQAGNYLYLSDSKAHVIRQLNMRTGMLRIVAGTSNYDGLSYIGAYSDDVTGYDGGAYFNTPRQMAWSTDQTKIYVADAGNNCIRVITVPTGTMGDPAGRVPFPVTTLVGQAGTPGMNGGYGSDALLSSPTGLAIDGRGWETTGDILYISDSALNSIRAYSFQTGYLSTVVYPWSFSQSYSGAGLSYLAMNLWQTELYVTSGDTIVKVNLPQWTPPVPVVNTTTTTGTNTNTASTTTPTSTSTPSIEPDYFTTIIAGSDSSAYQQSFLNGLGTQSRMNAPQGVVYDVLNDQLLVADRDNNLIRTVSLGNTTLGVKNTESKVQLATIGTFIDGKMNKSVMLTDNFNVYMVAASWVNGTNSTNSTSTNNSNSPGSTNSTGPPLWNINTTLLTSLSLQATKSGFVRSILFSTSSPSGSKYTIYLMNYQYNPWQPGLILSHPPEGMISPYPIVNFINGTVGNSSTVRIDSTRLQGFYIYQSQFLAIRGVTVHSFRPNVNVRGQVMIANDTSEQYANIQMYQIGANDTMLNFAFTIDTSTDRVAIPNFQPPGPWNNFTASPPAAILAPDDPFTLKVLYVARSYQVSTLFKPFSNMCRVLPGVKSGTGLQARFQGLRSLLSTSTLGGIMYFSSEAVPVGMITPSTGIVNQAFTWDQYAMPSYSASLTRPIAATNMPSSVLLANEHTIYRVDFTNSWPTWTLQPTVTLIAGGSIPSTQDGAGTDAGFTQISTLIYQRGVQTVNVTTVGETTTYTTIQIVPDGWYVADGCTIRWMSSMDMSVKTVLGGGTYTATPGLCGDSILSKRGKAALIGRVTTMAFRLKDKDDGGGNKGNGTCNNCTGGTNGGDTGNTNTNAGTNTGGGGPTEDVSMIYFTVEDYNVVNGMAYFGTRLLEWNTSNAFPVRFIAGSVNEQGLADGYGSAVRFSNPVAMTSMAGMLFIAENTGSPWDRGLIRLVSVQDGYVYTLMGAISKYSYNPCIDSIGHTSLGPISGMTWDYTTQTLAVAMKYDHEIKYIPVNGQPLITEITPRFLDHSATSTRITITGVQFGINPDALGLIKFGYQGTENVCIDNQWVSETMIMCTLQGIFYVGSVFRFTVTVRPRGWTGNTEVSAPSIQTLTIGYVPTITSVRPSFGLAASAGTMTLTLEGNFFGSNTGELQDLLFFPQDDTTFAGLPCQTLTWVNDTLITCDIRPSLTSFLGPFSFQVVLSGARSLLTTDDPTCRQQGWCQRKTTFDFVKLNPNITRVVNTSFPLITAGMNGASMNDVVAAYARHHQTLVTLQLSFAGYVQSDLYAITVGPTTGKEYVCAHQKWIGYVQVGNMSSSTNNMTNVTTFSLPPTVLTHQVSCLAPTRMMQEGVLHKFIVSFSPTFQTDLSVVGIIVPAGLGLTNGGKVLVRNATSDTCSLSTSTSGTGMASSGGGTYTGISSTGTDGSDTISDNVPPPPPPEDSTGSSYSSSSTGMTDPSNPSGPPIQIPTCPYCSMQSICPFPALNSDDPQTYMNYTYTCQCFAGWMGDLCDQPISTYYAVSQTLVCAEGTSIPISLQTSVHDGIAFESQQIYISSLPADGDGLLFNTDDGVTPGTPVLTVPTLVTDNLKRILYQPPTDTFNISRAADTVNPYTGFQFYGIEGVSGSSNNVYGSNSVYGSSSNDVSLLQTSPAFIKIRMDHENQPPTLQVVDQIQLYQDVLYQQCCTTSKNVGTTCQCPVPFVASASLPYQCADIDSFNNPIRLRMDAVRGNFSYNYTYLAAVLSAPSVASTKFLSVKNPDDGSTSIEFTGMMSDALILLNSWQYRSSPIFESNTDDITINLSDLGQSGEGGPQEVEAITTLYVTQINQPITFSGFGNITFTPNVPKNKIPTGYNITIGTIKGEENKSFNMSLILVDSDAFYGRIFVNISVGYGNISFNALLGKGMQSQAYINSNPELLAFPTAGDSGRNDPGGTAFYSTLQMANLLLSSIIYTPYKDYYGKDLITLYANDMGNTGQSLPGKPASTQDLKFINLNIAYGLVPPDAKNVTMKYKGDTFNTLTFDSTMLSVDTTVYSINITTLPSPACATVYQVLNTTAAGVRGAPILTTPLAISDSKRRIMIKLTTGFYDTKVNPLCTIKWIAIKPQTAIQSVPLYSSTAFINIIPSQKPQTPLATSARLMMTPNTPLVITLSGVNKNKLPGGKPLPDDRYGLTYFITSLPTTSSGAVLYQVQDDASGTTCFNGVKGDLLFNGTLTNKTVINIPVTSRCGQVWLEPPPAYVPPPKDPKDPKAVDPPAPSPPVLYSQFTSFTFVTYDGILYSDVTGTPGLLGASTVMLNGPPPPQPLGMDFELHSSLPGADIRAVFTPSMTQLLSIKLYAVILQTLPKSGKLYTVEFTTGLRKEEVTAAQLPFPVYRSSSFPSSLVRYILGFDAATIGHIGLLYAPANSTILGVNVDSFTYTVMSLDYLNSVGPSKVSVTIEPSVLPNAPLALAKDIKDIFDATVITLDVTHPLYPSSDPLVTSFTFTITTLPLMGVLTMADTTPITTVPTSLNANDAQVVYTTSYLNAYLDSFSFQVNLQQAGDSSTVTSNIARVGVMVNTHIIPPTALSDSYDCSQGKSCLITLKTTDPKTSALGIEDMSRCKLLMTTLVGDGSLKTFRGIDIVTPGVLLAEPTTRFVVFYNPPVMKFGVSLSTSFSYQVVDQNGDMSGEATVSISVPAVYEMPIAYKQRINMPADTVQLIELTGSSNNVGVTYFTANLTSLPRQGKLFQCACPCVNISGTINDTTTNTAVFGDPITSLPALVQTCPGATTFFPLVYFIPLTHVSGTAADDYLSSAFTFCIFDGVLYSAALDNGVQSGVGVEVLIAVTPVPHIPVAFNLSYTSAENNATVVLFKTTTLSSALLNNGGGVYAGYDLIDASVLQVQIMSWPKNGLLYLSSSPQTGLVDEVRNMTDGVLPYSIVSDSGTTSKIVYMPSFNWWGIDSFSFRLVNKNNRQFISNVTQVKFNVTFVLHKPEIPTVPQPLNVSSSMSAGQHMLLRLQYSDPDNLREMFPSGSKYNFSLTIMKVPTNGYLYQLDSNTIISGAQAIESTDPDYGSPYAIATAKVNSNKTTSSRRLLDDTTGLNLTAVNYNSTTFPLGAKISLDRTAVTHPLKYLVFVPDSNIKDKVILAGSSKYASIQYTVSNGVYQAPKPFAQIDLNYFPKIDIPKAIDASVTLLQNTFALIQLPFIQDRQLAHDGDVVSGFLATATKNGALCVKVDLDPVTGVPLQCTASQPRLGASNFASFADSDSGSTYLNIYYFPNRNVYSPNSTAVADTFSYFVSDNLDQDSNTATVKIYITHVNQPPVVASELVQIWKTEPTSLSLKASDPDDAYSTLTFALVDLPGMGALYEAVTDSTTGVTTNRPVSSNAVYQLPAHNVTVGNVTKTTAAKKAWKINYPQSLVFDPLEDGASYPYVTLNFYVVDPHNASSADYLSIELNLDCSSHFMYPNVWASKLLNQSGDICQECVTGALCSAQGDKQPVAAFGYWPSDSIEKLTFISCQPAYSCKGGQAKASTLTFQNTQLASTNDDSGCAEGYTGRRCGICKEGYYKLDLQCVKCAELNHLLFAIFGYALPLALVLGLVAFFTLKLRVSPTAISVLVTFAQTLSTFQNFNLGWPGSSKSTMQASSVFNLNVDLLSVECYIPNPSFVDKWITLMVAPFFVGILIALMYSVTIPIYSVVEWYRARRDYKLALITDDAVFKLFQLSIPESQRTIGYFMLRRVKFAYRSFVGLYVQFLTIAFLSLSTTAMRLLKCTNLPDGSIALDVQPQLRCDEPWWSDWKPIAIVFTILYSSGIPLMLVYILFRTRPPQNARPFLFGMFYCPKPNKDWEKEDRLLKRRESAAAGHAEIDLHARAVQWSTLYGSFIQQYKFEYYYWALIQMSRSMVISVAAVWLGEYVLYQALVCLVTMLVSAYVTLKARPYHEYLGINLLEINCLACNTFVLFLGILIYSSELDQGSSKYPYIHTALELILTGLIASTVLNICRLLYFQIRTNLRYLKKQKERRAKLEEDALNDAAKFGEVLEKELAVQAKEYALHDSTPAPKGDEVQVIKPQLAHLDDDDEYGIGIVKKPTTDTDADGFTSIKKQKSVTTPGDDRVGIRIRPLSVNAAVYANQSAQASPTSKGVDLNNLLTAAAKAEHKYVSTHMSRAQERIQHTLAAQHDLWKLARRGKLDDGKAYYSRAFRPPRTMVELMEKGMNPDEAKRNDGIIDTNIKRRDGSFAVAALNSIPQVLRALQQIGVGKDFYGSAQSRRTTASRHQPFGMSENHMNLVKQISLGGTKDDKDDENDEMKEQEKLIRVATKRLTQVGNDALWNKPTIAAPSSSDAARLRNSSGAPSVGEEKRDENEVTNDVSPFAVPRDDTDLILPQPRNARSSSMSQSDSGRTSNLRALPRLPSSPGVPPVAAATAGTVSPLSRPGSSRLATQRGTLVGRINLSRPTSIAAGATATASSSAAGESPRQTAGSIFAGESKTGSKRNTYSRGTQLLAHDMMKRLSAEKFGSAFSTSPGLPLDLPSVFQPTTPQPSPAPPMTASPLSSSPVFDLTPNPAITDAMNRQGLVYDESQPSTASPLDDTHTPMY